VDPGAGLEAVALQRARVLSLDSCPIFIAQLFLHKPISLQSFVQFSSVVKKRHVVHFLRLSNEEFFCVA
jgi:hypothetical protein